VELFGTLHVTLIVLVAAAALTLSWLCRRGILPARPLRIAIGVLLIVNELVWWWFRYSHEGLRFPHNLPLQLCDATLWLTAIACLTPVRPIAEFAYFAGIGGAGMAVLTPDLWSPCPSYPAIYFFVAHGGIIAGAAVLVWGGIVRLNRGSVWRAFAILALYAAVVGAFNAVFGSNYMYLCRKPESASLLDALGPWPWYLVSGAAVALGVFWLLYVPVHLSFGGRASSDAPSLPSQPRTLERR
jgi:hypothetical integral membrane protein (TIGR02206 family)